VLVFPSPKLQFHDVGVLDDVSVNWTVRGAVPETGLLLNPATGICGPVVVGIGVVVVMVVTVVTGTVVVGVVVGIIVVCVVAGVVVVATVVVVTGRVVEVEVGVAVRVGVAVTVAVWVTLSAVAGTARTAINTIVAQSRKGVKDRDMGHRSSVIDRMTAAPLRCHAHGNHRQGSPVRP
jgi:hypothetical protein